MGDHRAHTRISLWGLPISSLLYLWLSCSWWSVPGGDGEGDGEVDGEVVNDVGKVFSDDKSTLSNGDCPSWSMSRSLLSFTSLPSGGNSTVVEEEYSSGEESWGGVNVEKVVDEVPLSSPDPSKSVSSVGELLKGLSKWSLFAPNGSDLMLLCSLSMFLVFWKYGS